MISGLISQANFYAVVFETHDFENYMDFAFYEFYICLLFQSIVRDNVPDISCFFQDSLR